MHLVAALVIGWTSQVPISRMHHSPTHWTQRRSPAAARPGLVFQQDTCTLDWLVAVVMLALMRRPDGQFGGLAAIAAT